MANKKYTIKLHRAEIMFAVSSKAHVLGDALLEADYKAAALVEVTDENMDVVRPIMDAAANTVIKAAGEYVSPAETTFEPDGKVIIVLNMPDNFNEAYINSIRDNMHDYIVNSTVGEWFLTIGREEAAKYSELASANMTAIISGLYARVRPTKPTL
jgi:hypothetical protein